MLDVATAEPRERIPRSEASGSREPLQLVLPDGPAARLRSRHQHSLSLPLPLRFLTEGQGERSALALRSDRSLQKAFGKGTLKAVP